jgi:hypothetical protein
MSSTELVSAYLVERARLVLFVPLALLIAATAWLAAPRGDESVASFVARAAQAFLFVLAFRVWDDLEDRARDATWHPDRVAVRTKHTLPLVGLSALLAATGLLSLIGASAAMARLAILAAIALGLAAWYHARPAEPSRLAGMVVLAKYPAIAIALAPGLAELSAARAAIATGVLYVVACMSEYVDDRSRGVS